MKTLATRDASQDLNSIKSLKLATIIKIGQSRSTILIKDVNWMEDKEENNTPDESSDKSSKEMNQEEGSVKPEKDIQFMIEEEEKKIIKSNTEKVVGYLKEIGIDDLETEPEKNMVIVPFEYEDMEFLSQIVISDEWYVVKVAIFELEGLDDDQIFDVFSELLKGNFILNLVTYSVDPERKSIWVEADIPAEMDFDFFKLEYISLIFGIDYFIKSVIPTLGIDINNLAATEQKKKSKEDNLYI